MPVQYTGTTASKLYIHRNGKTAATFHPATATYSYWAGDHLDSVCVITDGAGSVTSRRDFLPFGEEIAAKTMVCDTDK